MSEDILYRTIDSSPEIIEGIRSGLYSVWGGVVRIAKGGEGAGRIIGHLRFPGDAEQAEQSIEHLRGLLGRVEGLQETLAGLQNLQYANLALSGLNLAVSAAGFAIVCKKLNGISNKLDSHSEKLDILIEMAKEARVREELRDSARFRASLKTIRQCAETGDYDGLKAQIGGLNEQYEMTKLTLSRAATGIAGANFNERLDAMKMLQERMMHLAFLQSYLNQRLGYQKYAVEALRDLQSDWVTINSTIVDTIEVDRKWVESLNQNDASHVVSLLRYRKDMNQAIEYQAGLLALKGEDPRAAQFVGDEREEILFMAA